MKLRMLSLALALVVWVPLCPAQDTDAPAAKTEKAEKGKKADKAKKSANLVAKSFKDCKFISGRPSAKANYYIYASVPRGADTVQDDLVALAALHTELKKDKLVDIIFISGDAKDADAKKALSKAKAKFASALASGKGISALPGFKLSNDGLTCVMVDGNGNCVTSGTVADMGNWQQAVEDHEKALENAAAFEAATPSNEMGQCLKKMKFISAARPSLDAKYYIFLRSASWCGPCNKEMPNIVKYYADMQKDPRVCLILIDCDDSEEAAHMYMNKYGATFPAIMKNDPQAEAIPGMSGSPGIPWCWFITADGKQLFNGFGGNIQGWKTMCDNADAKGDN